jgi:hypothetical protein
VFGQGVIFRAQRDGKLSVIHHYESYAEGFYKGPMVCSEDGTLYAITGGGETLARLSRDGTTKTFNPPSLTGSPGHDLLINAAGEILLGTVQAGIWKLTVDDRFEYFGGGGLYPTGLKLLQDGSIIGISFQSSYGDGARIFRLDAEGTYSVLHEFKLPFEGFNPFWLVEQDDGTIIGTTRRRYSL